MNKKSNGVKTVAFLLARIYNGFVEYGFPPTLSPSRIMETLANSTGQSTIILFDYGLRQSVCKPKFLSLLYVGDHLKWWIFLFRT